MAQARSPRPPIDLRGTSQASTSCSSAPAMPDICVRISHHSSSRRFQKPITKSWWRFLLIWWGLGWTLRACSPFTKLHLEPAMAAMGPLDAAQETEQDAGAVHHSALIEARAIVAYRASDVS